jgi:hypothetical protein
MVRVGEGEHGMAYSCIPKQHGGKLASAWINRFLTELLLPRSRRRERSQRRLR